MPSACSSRRAKTRKSPASAPPETQALDPFSTNPPSARRAVVRSAKASLPACASESEKAPIRPPASGGSSRRRCSRRPKRLIALATMVLWTSTRSATAASARARPSTVNATSKRPRPLPPSCSGTATPKNP